MENLHLRLVFESNGILSYKSSTTVVQPSTQTTIVSIPVTSVSTTDFALLGIDFANPAFIGYDYTQNKRFPRTITTVLDKITLSIVEKIDSKNNRDILFIQILDLLDNKIRSTNDIKERKILQYIRNHVYLEQQERNILR
ncbi:hypothetical protein GW830_02190 [bacterium]|nr:hypothetical protein [bacterium]